MSTFYDPWTHAIQIFLTRLLQFIVLSLLLSLLGWFAILHWYFNIEFIETTRQAINGDNHAARAMLALCIGNGALLTGWLFTWLMMRWPVRHAARDRHHRGAQVVFRDDE